MSPTVITSLLACTAAALAATLGFAWWRQRARLLETERQLAEFSRVVSVLRLAQASDATAAETAHATPPPSPENLALGPLARSWQPKDDRMREVAEARLAEAAELLGSGTLRIEAVEARGDGRWALIVLRLTQVMPAAEVSILREELLLGVEGRWLVVARFLRGEKELRRARDPSYESLLEWFRSSEPDLAELWLHER